MNGIVSQNMNRGHAVQQLKKYLKTDDTHEAEIYLNASLANTMIYIGDSLARIAKGFDEHEDVDIVEDVDRKLDTYQDLSTIPEDD